MADNRLLADRVDGKGDVVVNALSVNRDPAGIAVKREGHGDERLQRIALRAAVRRDIGLARADAARQWMTHG